MQIYDDTYDAGAPLELFRANEKINACKRKWLAEEIVRLNIVATQKSQADVRSLVMDVVLTLAEQSKLILYQQPLELSQQDGRTEGTLMEQVTAELANLQAMGKIDVEMELNATFVGDKRVLADIKLLARSGYGEDSFGNNIPLPEQLTYLRR